MATLATLSGTAATKADGMIKTQLDGQRRYLKSSITLQETMELSSLTAKNFIHPSLKLGLILPHSNGNKVTS